VLFPPAPVSPPATRVHLCARCLDGDMVALIPHEVG